MEVAFRLEDGFYSLVMKAGDNAGNQGTLQRVNFSVAHPPKNLPPVPVISAPENWAIVREGWPVILSAEGTHDDGLGKFDPVRLSWTSNVSGYLGSGIRVQVRLEPGTHLITLFADDGDPGHNVSTNIVVTVHGTDQADGAVPGGSGGSADYPLLLLALAFFMIVALGGVIIAIMAYSKKRTVETRMDVKPDPSDLPEFPEI
jgi:hypothetical protein